MDKKNKGRTFEETLKEAFENTQPLGAENLVYNALFSEFIKKENEQQNGQSPGDNKSK